MIISHLHFVSLPPVLTVSASAALPADRSEGSLQKEHRGCLKDGEGGFRSERSAASMQVWRGKQNDRLVKGNNINGPGGKLYFKVDLTSLLSFHGC